MINGEARETLATAQRTRTKQARMVGETHHRTASRGEGLTGARGLKPRNLSRQRIHPAPNREPLSRQSLERAERNW